MTFPVSLVNTAVDTWQVLVNRVNTLANLSSNAFVTVDATANGSVSTGNTRINGVFSAATIAAGALRGGNNQVSSSLVISSNVVIGSATINTSGHAALTHVSVGASASINSLSFRIGNTTSNVVVNSTAVVIGGSNAATVLNRSAVGAFSRGKLNFLAGDNITLSVTDDAAGGQINVQINAASMTTTPGGGDGQVQFNSSGAFSGTPGLVFNYSTNNFSVSNTVTALKGVISSDLAVGANVVITTGGASVGNSTVNVAVNSTAVVIGGSNAATVTNRAAAGAFARQKFNFLAGQNITLSVTDDAAGGQINVQINSTSTSVSTSPGGSNGQVQFNDSGAFGGATGLGWNKQSNNLTVSNNIFAANSVAINDGSVLLSHVTLTTSGTTAQLLDSWPVTSYRVGFYSVSIKNNSANGYHATQLTLMQDGTDTDLNEYGVMWSNTSLGTFSANVNAGTCRLYFTPTSLAATVRASRTLIVV